ncbi:amidohydrolase [Xylariaceae sp. FL1019]|nr:amidohydrolase [Xylariaceae sp. FL1019]
MIQILDSHIHLYPESELSTLAWCTPEHELAKQHSVDDYRAAASKAPLAGFIFVETDRKNDLDSGEEGWRYPLMEVSWLKRIITAQPKPGEGHDEDKHASLCKAYIPWAPLPSGSEVMKQYIDRVFKEAGDSWEKVRGFRYLLQDKPAGTMLQDDFIESLKLLGRMKLVFEVGVDQHRRGRAQLEELVDMIDRAHDGVPEHEKVVFIINHMCKPDFAVYDTKDPKYIAWRSTIYTLSLCKQVYMKLSGGFSEMDEGLRGRSVDYIVNAIGDYLTALLVTFGPERLMFGSDWPVCTVGMEIGSWDKWLQIIRRFLDLTNVSIEGQQMIFQGTATIAYGLDLQEDKN